MVGRTDRTTDEMSTGALDDGADAVATFWESRDVDFVGQPSQEDGKPLSTADLKLLTRVKVRYRGTGQASDLICTVSLDGGSTSLTPCTPTASVSTPR